MAKPSNNPKDYHQLVQQYLGYSAKREITNLDGRYLTPPSHDVFIDDSGKISIRPGYTLVGNARTGIGSYNYGIRSSFDWDTSSGYRDNLRQWGRNLEVLFDGNWVNIKNDFVSTLHLVYDKWWDNTMQQDVLVAVGGDTNIYEWSGGIANVANTSWNGSAGTITIEGYLTGTTFSFTPIDNTDPNNPIPAFISDSNSGFVAAGFTIGDVITVTGSTSNDGTYMVTAVAAGQLTLAIIDNLVTEAAGATITITNGVGGSWERQRFYVNSQFTTRNSGVTKIRFNGIDYTYTGGADTSTLTGVTPNPTAIPNGSQVTQTMFATQNASPIPIQENDWCKILDNQLYIGSKSSQMIYLSHQDDYTDFSFSAIRLPYEGGAFPIDSYCTGFVVQEGDMYVGGGQDSIYQSQFTSSADLTTQSFKLTRLQTGPGQSWLSQGAISHIKNSVVMISHEPTMDIVGRLQQLSTPQEKPTSDIIKDDFISYNFEGVNQQYFQNYIYTALPAEGKTLLYDLQRQLWQPPWTIPLSCFGITKVAGKQVLLGHSAYTNETYQLLTGTNDAGKPISWDMTFAYSNGGVRDLYKVMDEYFVEAYISQNGFATMEIDYEFEGAQDVKTFRIDATNPNYVFIPTNQIGGFGEFPFGTEPFGANNPPPHGDRAAGIVKYRRNFLTAVEDTFEWQTSFYGSSMNQVFQIIAEGPNESESVNYPNIISA